MGRVEQMVEVYIIGEMQPDNEDYYTFFSKGVGYSSLNLAYNNIGFMVQSMINLNGVVSDVIYDDPKQFQKILYKDYEIDAPIISEEFVIAIEVVSYPKPHVLGLFLAHHVFAIAKYLIYIS